MHAVRFFRVGFRVTLGYPFSERCIRSRASGPQMHHGLGHACPSATQRTCAPWPCPSATHGPTPISAPSRANSAKHGPVGRPARRRPCSCAQDGVCAQMPRRAHVPKTAGGATGGSLAHERAATELDRQGSLLLGMRTVPTTARALQQAAHPCLDPHDEREDGGRLVERQSIGVHLEGDRISHLQ